MLSRFCAAVGDVPEHLPLPLAEVRFGGEMPAAAAAAAAAATAAATLGQASSSSEPVSASSKQFHKDYEIGEQALPHGLRTLIFIFCFAVL